MTSITFSVAIDKAISSGHNCPIPPVCNLSVDVPALTQEQRELIASRITATGMIHSRDEDGREHPIPVTADAPTVEALCAAIAAENEAIATYADRQAAAKAAEAEADRVASEAALDSALVAPVGRAASRVYLRGDLSVGVYAPGSIESVEWQYDQWSVSYLPDASIRDSDRAKTVAAECQRLTNESSAKAIAAAAAKLEQLVQDRRDWVAAHGSTRLRRMMVEGIDCESTYQSERSRFEASAFDADLAEARPGWAPCEESEIDRDIKDVSLQSLALIEAGRATCQNCRLVRHTGMGRLVCVDEYCGRLICWPKD